MSTVMQRVDDTAPGELTALSGELLTGGVAGIEDLPSQKTHPLLEVWNG